MSDMGEKGDVKSLHVYIIGASGLIGNEVAKVGLSLYNAKLKYSLCLLINYL